MTLQEAITKAKTLAICHIGCSDRDYFVTEGFSWVGRCVARHQAGQFFNVNCTKAEREAVFGSKA